MAIRHVLSILSASLLTCAVATGAMAETTSTTGTKKAQSTQAPKEQTSEKKKQQQEGWEPICPPDCGTAKK